MHIEDGCGQTSSTTRAPEKSSTSSSRPSALHGTGDPLTVRPVQNHGLAVRVHSTTRALSQRRTRLSFTLYFPAHEPQTLHRDFVSRRDGAGAAARPGSAGIAFVAWRFPKRKGGGTF